MSLYEAIPITHMSLLVTLACNLRCVYCYEDKTGAIMDEKTAFMAVDWLIKNSANMKRIRIVFFGGEPLLNFQLIKSVVTYAEEETQKVDKKVTFSITTNGTLLDDEKIQFLADHKINVMLSFDGTKELQDAQRPYASGRGSYDLVLPKIQKLLKVAPNTTGHSVIVGNTSPEIVKDALQEIGFRRVSVAMNSQSLFDEKDEEKTLIRNTQSMFHVLDEEAKAWRELIKDRNVLSLKRLMGRSNLYGAILHLLNQSKKRYFCGAGRSMVSVTPSSDIYLCHRFVGLDEYKVGNLNHSTLNLDAFIQSPVETNTECIKCSARYYCGGGCKHDHVSASGSINHPEENMCKIKRHELELAASIVRDLSHEEGNWLIKEKIFPPKPCPLDL